jgi:hypothetical protein
MSVACQAAPVPSTKCRPIVADLLPAESFLRAEWGKVTGLWAAGRVTYT